MTGVIPPLPLPPLPAAVTVPTPIVTVTVPLPLPTLPTLPVPTTVPVETTLPVPTTPPATGPPSSPPPAGGPATTSAARPTAAPTTSPGDTAGSAPTSTECASPTSTSTSTSTSTPDGSIPDSSDASTSEPAVQLPVPACEPGGTATTAPAPSGSVAAGLSAADLATAAALASVEVLEVNAHAAVRQAAEAGSLGDTAPAVSAYLTTAIGHHQGALDAWNDVLIGAGQAAVTSSPLNLTVTANEQFAVVRDVAAAAGVLWSLERTAAATYLFAVRTLASPALLQLATSILPVDRQHVSALLFLLGRDPVPEAFATEDFAYVSATTR